MVDDPRPDFTPDWPTCDAKRCRGVRHGETQQCFSHSYALPDVALMGFVPGVDLDLRGVSLSATDLTRIFARFHDGDRFLFGDMRFDHAWFSGEAEFVGVTFGRDANFANAWFSGRAVFSDVTCTGQLSFIGAQFEATAEFIGVEATAVDLDQARFAKSATMRIEGQELSLESTRFESGVGLWVAKATISAGGAYFGAASGIVGIRNPQGDLSTKLVTLAGGDVSNLVLTDLDLSECTFIGTHRLDQLRIEGLFSFTAPPHRWHTPRLVIADELSWRGWGGDPLHRAEPGRVAAVYRSLRKSFEDRKNEAGAGDFYYGEMEARRHLPSTSRAERTVLWCYWLLSGYGQRAARAVAALVVLVVTVATLLIVWGQPFGHAARIAVGAVVFRDDRTDLTEAGEWTVLAARFLGPVLLALAVLAVRARVKR